MNALKYKTSTVKSVPPLKHQVWQEWHEKTSIIDCLQGTVKRVSDFILKNVLTPESEPTRVAIMPPGITINDLGGGGAQAKAGKKLNCYLSGKENSTQQPGRKEHSTQQPGRRKKINSTTWKKKIIMNCMLSCIALNMDIHAFYILFRYK